MKKQASFIISLIFHPIVMNTLSLFLLFGFFPSLAALNEKVKSTIISVIVSLTVVIPVILVGFL